MMPKQPVDNAVVVFRAVPLDGLYRHLGISLVWDDVGVTFTRKGARSVSHVDWDVIDGVRQIGERPGFVQLLVRDLRHPPTWHATRSASRSPVVTTPTASSHKHRVARTASDDTR